MESLPHLENFTLIWASWVVGRLVVSPRVKKGRR